jgi:hypothetical protein
MPEHVAKAPEFGGSALDCTHDGCDCSKFSTAKSTYCKTRINICVNCGHDWIQHNYGMDEAQTFCQCGCDNFLSEAVANA